MIKTAIALIAVINIITGQANTCHCHHSNIAININIPTDKCRCHHSCHPGRQVLSIFPLTSTVVIILFIQDDKYYHHFRHSGRQVQAAVEELLRHVALLERDCQASLAKISFHIFLAESKIQNVSESFLPGFFWLFGCHGICTNSLPIFLARLLPGQVELMHTHTTPMIYYILQVTKAKTIEYGQKLKKMY